MAAGSAFGRCQNIGYGVNSEAISGYDENNLMIQQKARVR